MARTKAARNPDTPAPSKWRFARYGTIPFELPSLARRGASLFSRGFSIGRDFEKAVEHTTSVPANALAMRVFDRLSELTGIPTKKLMPRVLTNSKVVIMPAYSGRTHELVTSGTSPQLEHHEMLHATQYLLTPKPIGGFIAYNREREPTADHLKYTGTVGVVKVAHRLIPAVYGALGAGLASMGSPIAGGVIGAMAVGDAIGGTRELIVRRAVSQYGHDGWIALHAHGRFEPLASIAILHSLERRGFITRNGFTTKGEKWIKSLKPEIETRIAQFERNRREE